MRDIFSNKNLMASCWDSEKTLERYVHSGWRKYEKNEDVKYVPVNIR